MFYRKRCYYLCLVSRGIAIMFLLFGSLSTTTRSLIVSSSSSFSKRLSKSACLSVRNAMSSDKGNGDSARPESSSSSTILTRGRGGTSSSEERGVNLRYKAAEEHRPAKPKGPRNLHKPKIVKRETAISSSIKGGGATALGDSSSNSNSSRGGNNGVLVDLDKPFKLPPGEFRPKQSLGQNFLFDLNYVDKIVNAFDDDSTDGHRVVEIGPGPGALTRLLYQRYPKMTAIEVDDRAVEFLGKKMPDLNVLHMDVLKFDWVRFANEQKGPANIIANLPYYIVSQVLFSLADAHQYINKAVVTSQWEVAERLTAKPSSKQYGIPSVVFQLYATPKLLFKIPPKVFYPIPKVDSALVSIDFSKPHPDLKKVDALHLRKVLTNSFQQRRKMMRQSLKELMKAEGLVLPEKWSTLRPEQLRPEEFLELTADLYGTTTNNNRVDNKKEETSHDCTAARGVIPNINNMDNAALSAAAVTAVTSSKELDTIWRSAMQSANSLKSSSLPSNSSSSSSSQ